MYEQKIQENIIHIIINLYSMFSTKDNNWIKIWFSIINFGVSNIIDGNENDME